MKTIVAFPVSRKDADAIRAARGFASFKVWAQENRKWHKEHTRRKNSDLTDALEREFETYIRHNL